ncbi:protein kinase [Halobacteriales archaeon Cl-PHB]
MSPDSTGTRGEAAADADPVPPGVDLLVEPLLAGVAAEDDRTRRRAGRALCLLTDEYGPVAESLARNLVDRLSDAAERRAVFRTLAALDETHPKAVQCAVADAAGTRSHRVYAAVHSAEPWANPDDLRADGGAPGGDGTHAEAVRRVIKLAEGEASVEDVGHVRREANRDASVEDADSLGRTGTDARQAAAATSRRDPPAEDAVDAARGTADDRSAARKAREQAAASARAGGQASKSRKGTHSAGDNRSESGREPRVEQVQNSQLFTAIRLRSHVDDLQAMAPPTDRRFGKMLRSRAERNGEAVGVGVRLLPTPDDAAGLAPKLSESLSRWRRLAAVPGVVSVEDWGDRPRPWAITQFVDETLADRGRPDPATALGEVADLAAALAALHDHGVVHGGIDATSVAYQIDELTGTAQPMLDDVGLVPAYRDYVTLGSILDPTYAAPEYYDSDYGTVDAATDVYQFGAVAFRLCTGKAPFRGSGKEIREQVCSGRMPAPSEVNPALPEQLDQIVARATATQKLARFDSATRLHNELASLRDDFC